MKLETAIQSKTQAEHTINLEVFRTNINRADEQLLESLLWRMDIAKQIGQYKKANDMEILQASRWKELLKARMHSAQVMGLNTEFIEKMYTLIHEESIAVQVKVLNEL